MKIADGIHLIASGFLGISLTHRLDCNAYAIRCGSKYWLIDAGVGCDSSRILGQLEAAGIPAASLGGVLLTHSHLDHSGGAHWFHRELGLPIWAGPQTAGDVETGNEEAISLAAAKRAGIYPEDFPFRACPIARRLASGDVLEFDETRIEVIATPGHSRDMLTFLVHQPGRTLLFPGDTLFYGGRISLQATYDSDPPAYAQSLRTLSALSYQMMFPGHGLWSLEEAHRHIDIAMESVNRLLLPANL